MPQELSRRFSGVPGRRHRAGYAQRLPARTTVRGKYIILDKLGAGGMATVYKAKHIRFDELCALKVIGEQCLSDPALVERFQREAVIARRLRHENAVVIQDVDETEDGRPFIAMEFVAGKDFRALLSAEGPLPVERAVGIVAQIASALDAASALGIVHRDVKPANIMVCPGDQVKVLDFGIARMQFGEATRTLTSTGILVGTPDYMSPGRMFVLCSGFGTKVSLTWSQPAAAVIYLAHGLAGLSDSFEVLVTLTF